jgi:ferredoxin
MRMHRRVEVRADRCIGSGLCVGERPDIFRFNEEGISEAYGSDDEATDELGEVAELCPVSAIVVLSEDEGTANA